MTKQIPPIFLKKKYPLSKDFEKRVTGYRDNIWDIALGKDKRIIIFLGPCSINNIVDTIEYAHWLKNISNKFHDKLFLVMRVYIEKSRTTIGWKGFLRNPDLSEKEDIEKGTDASRKLFRDLTNLGIPIATEFVSVRAPSYLSDFISWAAIGARTAGSQVHRELVSGLNIPVGWKNSTSGNVDVAINSVIASSVPSIFEGIDDNGNIILDETSGNLRTNVVLRGGDKGPNYSKEDIDLVSKKLKEKKLLPKLIVDCSHDNSRKDYGNQPKIFKNLIDQIKEARKSGKESPIFGIMLESYIKEGSQPFNGKEKGVSITDSCISIKTTEELLEYAYKNL
jgi:3-deoxy-7-phosphoheptulonate synthase